ncbi:unnamed protein product [Auanema sp. JU1783]|nr:unnamed protein product [Auanema sp. JU1783]
MSYRELRNICEMTRALGYPRQLSIENFRTPNFKLVAELLEWIVKRFEPNASLSAQQTETEQERVIFIKQAVLLMLQNSRLRMNPKRLYQADGNAVQELLPAITVLYNATKQLTSEDIHEQWSSLKSSINQKLQDVKVARQLSSQLPQTAAALHDLLYKELAHREQRNSATARPVPLSEAEKSLQQAIAAINEETEELGNKLNNVANDEMSLDEKIERKKREYEQMQKRYAKLQAFRPQYMDEYENYEKRLQERYEIYVLQFRNLTYLQQLEMEIERSERNRQVYYLL